MAGKPASRRKPEAFKPTQSGEVSYRLLREAAVKRTKTNPLYKEETCDAHPMLLRAAKAIGEPTGRSCDICDQGELVLLRYAFGPRLPAEGKCLETAADQERLAKKTGMFICRVVEVCCVCSWNYMISSYIIKEPTLEQTELSE